MIEKAAELTRSQRVRIIQKILEYYDLEWYGAKLKPAQARRKIETMGVSMSKLSIRALAGLHCKFWLQQTGHAAPARLYSFTRQQWSAMAKWLERHYVGVGFSDRETLGSVTRRMQHAGICTNRDGVREAVKFSGLIVPPEKLPPLDVSGIDPGPPNPDPIPESKPIDISSLEARPA
jgi:hypothetical protein